MRDQLDLIAAGEWDVLVVLDACRADAFNAVAGRDLPKGKTAEAVRSPACCTAGWIKALGQLRQAGGGGRSNRSYRSDWTYFTANPVVSREEGPLGNRVNLVSAWGLVWGLHTPHRIPSVHPQALNGLVMAWDRWGADSQCPLVVHYLQPHSPFIGEPALPLARWGRGKGDLWRQCHALARPDVAVREGKCTWPEVKEAYLGNLRLVWDAARDLARALWAYRPGWRIVVTSDHGEVLGAGGRFGHEADWRDEELYRVPWLQLTPEIVGGTAADAATATREKLEALGYV